MLASGNKVIHEIYISDLSLIQFVNCVLHKLSLQDLADVCFVYLRSQHRMKRPVRRTLKHHTVPSAEVLKE